MTTEPGVQQKSFPTGVRSENRGQCLPWTPLLPVPWDLLLLLFSPSNNNHSLLPHALSRSRLRPPATPTRLNQGSKVPSNWAVRPLQTRRRNGQAGPRCPRSPREDTGRRGRASARKEATRPQDRTTAGTSAALSQSPASPRSTRSPWSSLRPGPGPP